MVHSKALGIRAVPGHIAGSEHAITSSEPLNRAANLDDDAGELPSQQNIAAGLRTANLPKKGFPRIDPDSANLDQNVTIAQCWLRNPLEMNRKILNGVGSFINQRLHGKSLLI